jgi:Putative peptidoglycan binding domain/LysM domain
MYNLQRTRVPEARYARLSSKCQRRETGIPTEYEIVQGDTVVGLAFRYGLLPNNIWDHPANSELKELRKDMNVLMPGDVLVIPDKEIKEVPRPVDQTHEFVRKGMVALYRLQVFDFEEPRAGQDYTLSIDDSNTLQGTTDKSGTLEQYVPANARKGVLVIGEDQAELTIHFGYLDPLNETTGLQKRLINLGFLAGEPNGQLDDETVEALKTFQARFGVPVTGEPDDSTLEKLKGMHDVISEFPPLPDDQAEGASDSATDT